MRAVLALPLLVLLALVAPAAADAAPAQIAFTSGDRIEVMNADGSGRAPLLELRDGLFAAQPAWSPDAQRIAFVAGNDSRSRVWTMAADGRGRRALGERRAGSTVELEPAWSPDGGRIAFGRLVVGSESLRASLVVADAATGAEQEIASETSSERLAYLTAPVWSPDGTRLLYTRTFVDEESYFHTELLSVAPDGSDRRLVAGEGSSASFSPDGSMIAFASTSDRRGFTCGSDECAYQGEIYVAAADGSAPRRLTRSKAHDDAPAWSPDGRRIAFESDRNDRGRRSPEIHSIGVDGGCLTWLTNGSPASTGAAWQPGAELSSDPGGCGGRGLRPYFALDIGLAEPFRRIATPFWIGPRTRSHLLLSSVYRDGRSLGMRYDDCARYRARECKGLLQIFSHGVCRTPRRLHGQIVRGDKVRLYRGALLVLSKASGGTVLITGRTAVQVEAGGISQTVVVRALRPVGARKPPKRFERPVLPRSVFRGAAAEVLERLGPFERADC